MQEHCGETFLRMDDKYIPRELIYSYFQEIFRPVDSFHWVSSFTLD